MVCFHDVFAHQEQARSAAALPRKGKVMVTIRVKGGIPEGCESLCRTCTRGHIITGFRATEEEVFCRTFYTRLPRDSRLPRDLCSLQIGQVSRVHKNGVIPKE